MWVKLQKAVYRKKPSIYFLINSHKIKSKVEYVIGERWIITKYATKESFFRFILKVGIPLKENIDIEKLPDELLPGVIADCYDVNREYVVKLFNNGDVFEVIKERSKIYERKKIIYVLK